MKHTYLAAVASLGLLASCAVDVAQPPRAADGRYALFVAGAWHARLAPGDWFVHEQHLLAQIILLGLGGIVWSLVRRHGTHLAPRDEFPLGAIKALSWENLHFEVSAYISRYYRKVVFLELVVERLEGCRHGSVSL